ncbi:splicing factor, arginine/serine-rich 15 [Pelomyxa schiedti]|nr:splicing factor, arginine/serine-rich 15 [Pelomyxa schiedti]
MSQMKHDKMSGGGKSLLCIKYHMSSAVESPRSVSPGDEKTRGQWEKDLLSALERVVSRKPPVSAKKIKQVTKLALEAVKFYKLVVHYVETQLAKSPKEHKLSILYIIDSICRTSKSKLGSNDVYIPRFSLKMEQTFLQMCQCAPQDFEQVSRIVSIWEREKVFPPSILVTLNCLITEHSYTVSQKKLPPDTPKPEKLDAQSVSTPSQGSVPLHPEMSTTNTPQASETGIKTEPNSIIPTQPPQLRVKSSTLWVGNLPPTADLSVLVLLFSNYGTIIRNNMFPDRGIAFIEFEKRECAEVARQALSGYGLWGNKIKVGWARGMFKTESFDYSTGEAVISHTPNPSFSVPPPIYQVPQAQPLLYPTSFFPTPPPTQVPQPVVYAQPNSNPNYPALYQPYYSQPLLAPACQSSLGSSVPAQNTAVCNTSSHATCELPSQCMAGQQQQAITQPEVNSQKLDSSLKSEQSHSQALQDLQCDLQRINSDPASENMSELLSISNSKDTPKDRPKDPKEQTQHFDPTRPLQPDQVSVTVISSSNDSHNLTPTPEDLKCATSLLSWFQDSLHPSYQIVDNSLPQCDIDGLPLSLLMSVYSRLSEGDSEKSSLSSSPIRWRDQSEDRYHVRKGCRGSHRHQSTGVVDKQSNLEKKHQQRNNSHRNRSRSPSTCTSSHSTTSPSIMYRRGRKPERRSRSTSSTSSVSHSRTVSTTRSSSRKRRPKARLEIETPNSVPSSRRNEDDDSINASDNNSESAESKRTITQRKRKRKRDRKGCTISSRIETSGESTTDSENYKSRFSRNATSTSSTAHRNKASKHRRRKDTNKHQSEKAHTRHHSPTRNRGSSTDSTTSHTRQSSDSRYDSTSHIKTKRRRHNTQKTTAAPADPPTNPVITTNT